MKAVVPLCAFRDKFGNLQADQFTDKVLTLALEFLHEHQPSDLQRPVPGIEGGAVPPQIDCGDEQRRRHHRQAEQNEPAAA